MIPAAIQYFYLEMLVWNNSVSELKREDNVVTIGMADKTYDIRIDYKFGPDGICYWFQKQTVIK